MLTMSLKREEGQGKEAVESRNKKRGVGFLGGFYKEVFLGLKKSA